MGSIHDEIIRLIVSNNVNLSQLYYWLKKENAPKEQPMWLPIEISEPCVESALNVRVGGVTVEVGPGFNPVHTAARGSRHSGRD